MNQQKNKWRETKKHNNAKREPVTAGDGVGLYPKPLPFYF